MTIFPKSDVTRISSEFVFSTSRWFWRFQHIYISKNYSQQYATIFQQSRLCYRFKESEFRSRILLGDSGYPNKKYLFTPLLRPANDAENRYNNAHIRTRNIVKRLFGVCKPRIPVLSLGMRVKIETAAVA